jgi:hypothetical protein
VPSLVILTIAMGHPRMDIVDAIVAMLLNATVAGARVYDHRVDPIKALPAISVEAWTEVSDAEKTSPRILKRDLEVDVIGFVEHTEAVSGVRAANNLGAQVEALLDADPFLRNLAEDCVLTGTTVGVRPSDGSGSPLVCEIAMTFGVTFRTEPIARELADDLTTVKATHKPTGGVADTPPNVDQFTVET